MLLVEVIAVVVEFLDGFGQLSVNFYEFLETLFQNGVFLLKLLIAFFQLLVLAFPGKVVLESVCHCVDFIRIIFH